MAKEARKNVYSQYKSAVKSIMDPISRVIFSSTVSSLVKRHWGGKRRERDNINCALARVNIRQESARLVFLAFLALSHARKADRSPTSWKRETAKRFLTAAITSPNCRSFKYHRRETDTAIRGDRERLERLSAGRH